jgi:alkylation response protein AidB-like acyl-CoA dehydrogenase
MQPQTSNPLAAANARDALDAATALRDLIWSNRRETEEKRQLAGAIVDAIVRSKLGRLALSTDYDGLEVSAPDQLAVFESLAEAEASVAWIVWNSTGPCWFARFLAEPARREIFCGPTSHLYASSTRPSGRARRIGSSYVINGRWSLVSGCLHAAWIPVMCLVEENGAIEMLAPNVPHMRLCFLPRDAYEIIDTWHVGGLRGTGSHDCELRGVAVPARHTFAIGDASLSDSPWGRAPIAATMSGGCASICLGIAAASLRALLELGGKVPVDGGPGLRDRAPVQSAVAKLETKIDALRERLKAACGDLWRKAQAGRHENADIAALFAAAVTTALECRAAVAELYAAAGASALYTDSPLERAHRDIHAVTQHIVLQPFWLEQAGRVRFGLEPTNPLFTI